MPRDEWVLSEAEITTAGQKKSDMGKPPNFGTLLEQLDWLEWAAEDLLWARTVSGEQMQMRLNELDQLQQTLSERLAHFRAQYEERQYYDEIDDRQTRAEIDSEQRLTARDVL